MGMYGGGVKLAQQEGKGGVYSSELNSCRPPMREVLCRMEKCPASLFRALQSLLSTIILLLSVLNTFPSHLTQQLHEGGPPVD